jgi:hypothetical protein
MTREQYKQFMSDVAALAQSAVGLDREAVRSALAYPATGEAFWDLMNPNADADHAAKVVARLDAAIAALEQDRMEHGKPRVFGEA